MKYVSFAMFTAATIVMGAYMLDLIWTNGFDIATALYAGSAAAALIHGNLKTSQ